MIEKNIKIIKLIDAVDDKQYWVNFTAEEQIKFQYVLRQRRTNFEKNQKLDIDFKYFVELLLIHKVDYILVGGYAVLFHGHLRDIGDIDFWIKPSEENLKSLLRALGAFGFENPIVWLKDISTKGNVIQLGLPPSRIDLLVGLRDMDFDSCLERSLAVKFDGVKLTILGIDDLRKSKKTSGRQKDLKDLDYL